VEKKIQSVKTWAKGGKIEQKPVGKRKDKQWIKIY